MIENILKYRGSALAVLLAAVSLCIWFYILGTASYTLYPPLSALMQSGSVPNWIMGLHYFAGALSLLLMIISAFKRERARWIIGLILVSFVVVYYKMTIHFMDYTNHV